MPLIIDKTIGKMTRGHERDCLHLQKIPMFSHIRFHRLLVTQCNPGPLCT